MCAQVAEHLLRSVVLPHEGNGAGKTGLRTRGTGRRHCGRCLRRSGAPGAAGGRRRCRGPAPDPARCLPWGASCGRASPTACPGRSAFKGNFVCSQREHHLAGRAAARAVCGSAQTKPHGWPIVTVPIGQPGGPQDGSQPGSPGLAQQGARGTQLAFLPAWRSSARERCPGPLPGLR